MHRPYTGRAQRVHHFSAKAVTPPCCIFLHPVATHAVFRRAAVPMIR